MSELPKGWSVATLPDLVGSDGVFVDGDWVESKDQDPNGDVRLIQLADVGDGHYVDKSNRFMTSAAAAALGCTDLKVGDVLIARMPDPLGRACLFPGDTKRAVTVVDVAIFRSGAGAINHRWLMHTVNAHQTRATIASLASGTTRTRISRGNLGTIDFPLPPLNEQRRIVEKLDAIFEKSRAAKARLERLPALLDMLKRSILAAAFRGDLTKDWRAAHPDVEPASVLLERIRAERQRRWEEGLRAKGKAPAKAKYEEPAPVDVAGLPELPEGWAWATLEAVTDPVRVIRYGILMPGPDVPNGVPYVKVRNIKQDRILVEDLLRTTKEMHEQFKGAELGRGDVLVTIRGTWGRVAVVPEAVFGGNITQDTARAAPLPLVSTEFLAHALRAPVVQDFLDAVAKGMAVKGVNITDLRCAPIAVPPLAEQAVVIAAVDEALRVHASLTKAHGRSTTGLLRADQAALAKAFQGELVPQDPTDEPASVLLDRIRATRAAEPQRARRGRADTDSPPPANQGPGGASNGSSTEGAEGEPVELVVAALQQAQRLTTSAIADATGLEAAAVRKALKALVEGGHVRVEGKARGTAYIWRGV